MAVKIVYKNGYPTKKCIKELLSSFGIDYGIKAMDAYEYNHSISWGNGVGNDTMLSFVDYVSELGVKVKDFREYESPITGSITFEKK